MLVASFSNAFEMSYPYQPYHGQASYSNHSTPPSFWDVDQQPQQPQDPLQVAVQPCISPQVFQQQLSPIESPVSLDHQPQQPQTAYTAPQTIRIQERVQPSQFRFDNIDESHFLQQQQESTETRRRSSSKAASRISGAGDEIRSSTASPGSAGAAGPSRVPHGKPHASHPYRRPSAASPTVGTSSSRNTGGMRSASSSSRAQQQRDSEVLGERSSRLSRVASPTAGSSMAVSCPAMHTWRVSSFPSVAESGEQPSIQRAAVGGDSAAGASDVGIAALSHGDQAATPTATGQDSAPVAQPLVGTVHPSGPPIQVRPQVARRLIIRTDVHYDPAANEMTAVFELPGLKKHDMTIRMHVCPYSGVRQLTVMGRSRPVLPEGMYTVQERKFGDFYRTVVVPLNTKPEDVVATMEDGILVLKVPCGTPAEGREEPQGINIH